MSGFKDYIRFNLADKNVVLPQIADWILPHWYERQNDSSKPTFMAGDNRFINLSCRSWITLRPLQSKEIFQVDRYGVIYLPGNRISIELWINFEEKHYHPVNFPLVRQKLSEDEFGVKTNYQLPGLGITTTLKPWLEPDRISFFIQPEINSASFIKEVCVSLVLRPYGNDGLSNVKSLEYKDYCLKVNNRTMLEFEKEPDFCYFTNEEHGDVSRFFQLGEGNTKINSTKGLATGLIGYSGLPAELSKIRILVGSKNQWYSGANFIGRLRNRIFPRWREEGDLLPQIVTGTKIDRIITANLNYFRVFESIFPQSVSQLRVLNQFFNKSINGYYLKECLKRVQWDGSLSEKSISPEELIWVIGDYYKTFNDHTFLEKIWPVIKLIGDGLWYKNGMDFFNEKQKRFLQTKTGYYERYFWICAALKTLGEIAQTLGRINEGEVFKEQYLKLWSGVLSSLTQTMRLYGSKIIPLSPKGGRGGNIVRNLAASYPLKLWERENPFIIATIDHLLNKHLSRGGLSSPLEFQGIDLALSAELGEVLIREGYDYIPIWDLLLSVASETSSWPDRISPLTLEGIGENGHAPEVTFRVLLLIRDLFVMEEGNCLILLPGVLGNNFWCQGAIEITNLPTHFGSISLKYHSFGKLIQLDFLPAFHRKPEKIRLILSKQLRPVFIDAKCEIKDWMMEIEPDFRSLRLKRVNTDPRA